jgi:hypothetical protein
MNKIKYPLIPFLLLSLSVKAQVKDSLYWKRYANTVDSVFRQDLAKHTQTGPSTLMYNNIADDLFNATNDTAILVTALKWVEEVLKYDYGSGRPWIMDTKANLLYKLKRVKEAIAFEKEAIENDNATKGERKGYWSTPLHENLDKMEKGIPTWNNR